MIGGGDGNDLPSGGFGPDFLDGGAGADPMIGGAGNDIVLGGSGSDRIVAPFFADIDTRLPADQVFWDLDAAAKTFTVTWDSVGYYDAQTEKLNSFQLQQFLRLVTETTDDGDQTRLQVDFDGGANGFVDFVILLNRTGLSVSGLVGSGAIDLVV